MKLCLLSMGLGALVAVAQMPHTPAYPQGMNRHGYAYPGKNSGNYYENYYQNNFQSQIYRAAMLGAVISKQQSGQPGKNHGVLQGNYWPNGKKKAGR